MSKYAYIFVLLNILHACVCQQETVVVEVAQGQLRGKVSTTVNGLQFYRFSGIPFAKPPVGDLRFKGPQAAEPWEGIRDALEEGSMCPQLDMFTNQYGGEEDCLFINVATTALPTNETSPLKPVMVSIHGGAFTIGSGTLISSGPDLLLEQDVVVVSPNYRLGPLGFLSTGDSVIPGNNGLKDQVLALRWVQQNIAQFGGDPNDVTIFGISAGGCSVHHLILSPMAAGLFHKAIAQSGSAIDQWGYDSPQVVHTKASQFCETLGVSTNNSDEMAELLLSVSAKDITEAQLKIKDREDVIAIMVYFKPTSEARKEGEEEVFLDDEPMNIIRSGKFNQVPFISGSVANEGTLILIELLQNVSRLQYYSSHPETLVPEDLAVHLTVEEREAVGQQMIQFYFGDEPILWNKLLQFVNLATDIAILYGVNRHVHLHAAVSTAPVYQYQFSFAGRWGYSKPTQGDSLPVVGHGDDASHLYYNPLEDYSQDVPEVVTAKRIVKMWTNFAKTGNPTPGADPLLQDITWSPVTALDQFYLDIGNDLIIKRSLQNDRMSFWEDIYVSVAA